MDRTTLLEFIAEDLHVSVFAVLLLERKGDPRIQKATARILSWEETGIRFEKPRIERRPLTFEMLGKPKRTRKKAKANPNKAWMGRSY